jgi:hypothetical protein
MKLLPLALAFGLPLQPVGHRALGRSDCRPPWQLLLAYLVLALTLLAFLKGAADPWQWWLDFDQAYYPAGRLILSDPYALYAGDQPDFFVNIPIVGLLFVPLAALPLAPAELVFAALGVLLVAAAFWLVLRRTGVRGWARLAVLGVFALNGPLYYSFREGNLTHYVLFLVTAALLCQENRREYSAGALLALAALIKIPLLLFGAYYLLRRRWRCLVGFAAGLLVLCGASVLLFGPDLHLHWFRQAIVPFAGKPMTAYNVQSLSGFLGRLLTDHSVWSWVPAEVGQGFRVTHLILAGLVLAAAGWVCWSAPTPAGPEADRLEFCITLCLALVTSPVSWTHYYLLLILPGALYLGDRLAVPLGPGWLAAMALALSLISPPSCSICSTEAWARPLLSHYLFGGLLLLGTLLAARRRVVAAALPAADARPAGRNGCALLRRAG